MLQDDRHDLESRGGQWPVAVDAGADGGAPEGDAADAGADPHDQLKLSGIVLQRHGWDIHVVSAEPNWGGGQGGACFYEPARIKEC
jgi:hypothetical protein